MASLESARCYGYMISRPLRAGRERRREGRVVGDPLDGRGWNLRLLEDTCRTATNALITIG
jgi:hypothetical protein